MAVSRDQAARVLRQEAVEEQTGAEAASETSAVTVTVEPVWLDDSCSAGGV